MTWKRIRALVALAGVGAAFAVVGIAVAPRSHSGIVPTPNETTGTCVDLAREVDPRKVPVDSGYDPEQDLVTAEYAGRTYVMRPGDATCLALDAARAVIQDAMGASRENTAVACAQISSLLRQKRATIRGRPFDPEAARRFLARRCAGGRP